MKTEEYEVLLDWMLERGLLEDLRVVLDSTESFLISSPAIEVTRFQEPYLIRSGRYYWSLNSLYWARRRVENYFNDYFGETPLGDFVWETSRATFLGPKENRDHLFRLACYER